MDELAAMAGAVFGWCRVGCDMEWCVLYWPRWRSERRASQRIATRAQGRYAGYRDGRRELGVVGPDHPHARRPDRSMQATDAIGDRGGVDQGQGGAV